MSIAADRVPRPELPAPWERLERASEDAAVAVAFWKRRAVEAEDEVQRLRKALEELAVTDRERPEDAREELRRVRAENAALQSRMLEARKRVGALMRRLATLGIES